MAYSPQLDQVSFTKNVEIDDSKLTISVYSYNKGTKKIQINREKLQKEGSYQFVKLGRLSKEETESLVPILQEAIKTM